MKTDNISIIGINETGQLFIKPEIEHFEYIWRSAAEVHWNDKEKYLFSPQPREWSYLDWYKHVVSVVIDEYGCKLTLTSNTVWINIPIKLRESISENQYI